MDALIIYSSSEMIQVCVWVAGLMSVKPLYTQTSFAVAVKQPLGGE